MTWMRYITERSKRVEGQRRTIQKRSGGCDGFSLYINHRTVRQVKSMTRTMLEKPFENTRALIVYAVIRSIRHRPRALQLLVYTLQPHREQYKKFTVR